MTAYEDFDPEEPRGWSPLAVAMIATLVLLLGLAGALFGIYVANVNAQAAVVDNSPTPQPEVIVTPSASATTKPPSPSPTATPSPSPTPTVSPGSIPLPKLSGLNFKDARTIVRDLKLNWVLTFEGANNDQAVRDTNPAFGTLVQKGTTVTIFVKGAAPAATPPVITGKQCGTAAELIVDAGLYPDYKSAARTGTVLLAPPQVGLRWNDKMTLTCSG